MLAGIIYMRPKVQDEQAGTESEEARERELGSDELRQVCQSDNTLLNKRRRRRRPWLATAVLFIMMLINARLGEKGQEDKILVADTCRENDIKSDFGNVGTTV